MLRRGRVLTRPRPAARPGHARAGQTQLPQTHRQPALPTNETGLTLSRASPREHRTSDKVWSRRPCLRVVAASGRWDQEKSGPRRFSMARDNRRRPMPLGFHSHPGGMLENSPTFQRWGPSSGGELVPKGRLKSCARSAVPSGLILRQASGPNVKTLGYSRKSLRDKDSARFRECSRASNPGDIGEDTCATLSPAMQRKHALEGFTCISNNVISP